MDNCWYKMCNQINYGSNMIIFLGLILLFILCVLLVLWLFKKYGNSNFKIEQFTIIFSLLFYTGLSLIFLIFKDKKSAIYNNIWAIIFICATPFILYALMYLLYNAKSFKTPFGEVTLKDALDLNSKELPFTQIENDTLNGHLLQSHESISKGDDPNLEELIKTYKHMKRKCTPLYLCVSFAKYDSIHKDTLKNYVYQLMKITRLQYVIFISKKKEIIGLVSVNDFIINFFTSINTNISIPQFFNENDIELMGSTYEFININTKLSEAFSMMVDLNVNVLLVRNESKFIGIVTKEMIINELIKQLTTKP